ncbi:MAG: 1-acyl-sn-glycerol-3-phosphate acyltransferase [Agarilytica sp.]
MHTIYKYWRILGTGFSFAVFGLGACVIALLMLLLLYPLPVNKRVKQHITRRTVWASTWVYIRMMRFLGLLSFEFENIDVLKNGHQLVIANHPTLLDVVFLLSVMPNTNCIVKAALFKNPFTVGVLSLAGYIPNSEDGDDLVNRAANIIKEGQTLIIFPEGTRTLNFGDLKFKRGAANIALRAQCPIRPVLIDCLPITLRKNEKWYQVPNSPPHFRIVVTDAMEITHCIDTTQPSSLQSRHLTRHLKDSYTERLTSL